MMILLNNIRMIIFLLWQFGNYGVMCDYFTFNHTGAAQSGAVITGSREYLNQNQAKHEQRQHTTANSCPQRCKCSLEPTLGQKLTHKYQPTSISINAVDCESITSATMQSLMLTVPHNVQYLSVKHSTLTQLSDICCFNDLVKLDVSFNQLETILTYVPFEKLKILNLQNNNLRVLRKDEFSSFSSLEVLNLDNNQIVTIHPETFRLLQLKELYLGHNQMIYLDERTFRFTPLLQILDIKANRLKKIHNRNFYFSRNLMKVDLSYNHIAVVDDDAFIAPLPQLAEVDLSNNNLTFVPTRSLRQLNALSILKMDGNPVEVLTKDSISLLTITQFHLSHATRFKMVLAGSFHNLPNLSGIFMQRNPKLIYISPEAFQTTQSINELYLSNNSIQYLAPSIVKQSQRLMIDGNPLKCECMEPSEKFACTNRISSGCKAALVPNHNQSISVAVGEPGNFFCVSIPLLKSSDHPIWTLPNQSTLPSTIAPSTDGRITYTSEYLGFLFFLASDRGRYSCRLGSEGDVRTVDVNVVTPAVHLFALEIGSEYVVLRWNQSLTSPNHSPHFKFRMNYIPVNDLNIENSTYEPRTRYLAEDSLLWNTYSVYRLKPDTNYSFCLAFQYHNATLYDFCTFVKTDVAYFGMGVTLNYSFIAILIITVGLIFAICTARCIHKRFHIWQEEKFRSRLAESLSGQSFLSSTAESLNSETYENLMMSTRSYEQGLVASSATQQSHGLKAARRTQYQNLHKSQYSRADQPSTSKDHNPETDALNDFAL